MTASELVKVYRLGAVSSVEASFFEQDDEARTDRCYLTRAEWETIGAPVYLRITLQGIRS